VKRLIDAQSWAQNVRDSLSKVKSWMSDHNSVVKVQMEVVDNLLSLNPVPCNEPAHVRLKVKCILFLFSLPLYAIQFCTGSDNPSMLCVQDFQKEASELTLEIDSVLSSCSNILVSLYIHFVDSFLGIVWFDIL